MKLANTVSQTTWSLSQNHIMMSHAPTWGTYFFALRALLRLSVWRVCLEEHSYLPPILLDPMKCIGNILQVVWGHDWGVIMSARNFIHSDASHIFLSWTLRVSLTCCNAHDAKIPSTRKVTIVVVKLRPRMWTTFESVFVAGKWMILLNASLVQFVLMA